MRPPIPPDAFPSGFAEGPDWPPQVPAERLRRWGIGLFLVSLAALFAATLTAYVTIRFIGPDVPPPGTVRLPQGLWWSTAVLLSCGAVVALAQHAARRGAVVRVRSLAVVAWSLSIAFLIIQLPSMVQLAAAHRLNTQHEVHGADGLIFTLIALHALHVLGGLLPLTRLVALSLTGSLGIHHLGSVRSCATYWHFLELVWLTMFGTFLVVR